MAITFLDISLPEYPPFWHGGVTNDLSSSAIYFNIWLLVRLLFSCVEWLVVDVIHYPWILTILVFGVLVMIWFKEWYCRLSTLQVMFVAVVFPSMPWYTGIAALGGFITCVGFWLILKGVQGYAKIRGLA